MISDFLELSFSNSIYFEQRKEYESFDIIKSGINITGTRLYFGVINVGIYDSATSILSIRQKDIFENKQHYVIDINMKQI